MKQMLAPVRRRVRWLRGGKGFFLGLLIALAGCLVAVAVSFFVPIEGLWRYLLAAVAGLPVIAGVLGLLLPVSNRAAARRADATGLKERAVTALSLEGNDTPMARLQRRDAQAALAALPVRRALPIRLPRALWMASLALALVTGILLLAPNPQDGVLRAQALERAVVRAQADEVEQAAEKMSKEGMTEEEQAELRRITGEMARALREADSKRDALETLDSAQREMDRLRAEIQRRTAQSLSDALGSQPGLQGLSDAAQSGSDAQMQEALAGIAQALATSEGQQSLAEQLSDAAAAAPAGSMQQSLANSAAAAQAGNAQQAVQSLAGACNSANPNATGTACANLAALMRMARSGVAQSSGSGSGQGQGTGQGSGGSGAGSGSSNQDGGSSSGSSQPSAGGGDGAITDRLGAYERIYDPTRLGGDAEASYVEGEMGEGESQQLQIGAGQGDLRGEVPYNQVIGEYQEAATQAMRRVSLPATLQDLVQRYFNALVD